MNNPNMVDISEIKAACKARSVDITDVKMALLDGGSHVVALMFEDGRKPELFTVTYQ